MALSKIEKFEAICQQFPDNHVPRFSLGQAYSDAGRWADAVASFEICVSRQADWAACLIALGDAHAHLGQNDRAADALRRARQAAIVQHHSSLASEAQDKLEAMGFRD